jgi:hypothetical protein
VEGSKLIEAERDADRRALADLASEFWKLLRNYDHVLAAAPENLKPGLVAQARFGSRRLAAILDSVGMHVETFEGLPYSLNLPVSAVNAEDFTNDAAPIVDQTLEPAIVQGTTAIKTGRVYLRAGNQ